MPTSSARNASAPVPTTVVFDATHGAVSDRCKAITQTHAAVASARATGGEPERSVQAGSQSIMATTITTAAGSANPKP